MKKIERPQATSSTTTKEQVACGNIYITVGKNNGNIIEVFATLGKAGSCAVAQNEALTRAVSLGLKYGIPIKDFVEELKDIKCPGPAWSDGELVSSCADAIAKVLRREIEDKETT